MVGVKDEAIGISKTDIRNLFQPFGRVGMNKTGGTGLGLIVCRMLMEAHKVRIWVELEVGKGSPLYLSPPSVHQEMSG